MDKSSAQFRTCMQPVTKTIVSCRDRDGRDNALVVAYCCNCSFDPPMVMVGIVPSRFSHHMVKESGCFVVNLPAKQNKELFDYVGSNSGRDGDKLKAVGAAVSNGATVNAPVLDDCPVNIECEVVDAIMTGSHEMFVGKITHVHADAQYVDGDGKIDFSKIDFL